MSNFKRLNIEEMKKLKSFYMVTFWLKKVILVKPNSLEWYGVEDAFTHGRNNVLRRCFTKENEAMKFLEKEKLGDLDDSNKI